MSVHLAKQVSKNARPTAPFSQRGLTSLTQAQLGDINIYCRANSEQLAYSGYARAIEAFIYATAVKQRVSTNLDRYPIPSTYIPTVPLSLPRLVILLASSNPEKSFLESFDAAAKELGGERKEMGKGKIVYVISRPTFKAARTSLPPVASPKSPFLDNVASIQAAYAATYILQFIDLFLSVQTYEYKGSQEERGAVIERGDFYLKKKVHAREDDTEIYGSKSKKRKVSQKEPTETDIDMEDDDEDVQYEEIDNLRDHVYVTSGEDAVLVAKPSPFPSSINYGGPGDVPYKPGLFFPYFPGMIASDNAHLRYLCNKLLFRNLGPENAKDSADAWKAFRENMNTLSSTPEGMILHHVLFGCYMALEGQARLFLVFADNVYKGFCLLGEEFAVIVAGTVHRPVSEHDLREQLERVSTSRAAAKDLVEVLKKCKDFEGRNIKASVKAVENCSDLADILASVDLASEGTPEEEEISSLLSRIHISNDFWTMNAKNVAKAIDDLHAFDKDAVFDKKIPFFIPTRDWRNINEVHYAILARFGSTSFSFRNQKGVEMKIPKDAKEEDPMKGKLDNGKEKRLYVYEKTVRLAVADWKEVVTRGSIKQDPAERSAGQRALGLVQDEEKELVWGSLKKMAAAGFLGTKAVKGVSSRDTGPVGFGTADFTDVFSL